MNENDEMEQVLETFNEWVESNCTPELLRFAQRVLPYEHWKLSYFKRRIRRCAAKGWMEGLQNAIRGYVDFASRIKTKYETVRRVRVSTCAR